MTVPLPLLADFVLASHVAIVVFVVGGLGLILVGNACGWRRVNAPWFRLAHLAAIVVVALEAWCGIECPLTMLERFLRRQGEGPAGAGGFIEHWLSRLLYFQAPPWVFTAAYTAFAMLVVASWWRFPPRPRRR